MEKVRKRLAQFLVRTAEKIYDSQHYEIIKNERGEVFVVCSEYGYGMLCASGPVVDDIHYFDTEEEAFDWSEAQDDAS